MDAQLPNHDNPTEATGSFRVHLRLHSAVQCMIVWLLFPPH